MLLLYLRISCQGNDEVMINYLVDEQCCNACIYMKHDDADDF